MRFLVDTNVFVHLGNQSRGWQQIANSIRAVGIEQCAMSAISAYELRYLLLRGPGRVKKENVQRLSAAFASVRNVLPVTGAVAPGLGQLRNLPRLQKLDQMRVFKSLGASGLQAIMPRTSASGAGLGDYTLKALCAYARRSAVICC